MSCDTAHADRMGRILALLDAGDEAAAIPLVAGFTDTAAEVWQCRLFGAVAEHYALAGDADGAHVWGRAAEAAACHANGDDAGAFGALADGYLTLWSTAEAGGGVS